MARLTRRCSTLRLERCAHRLRLPEEPQERIDSGDLFFANAGEAVSFDSQRAATGSKRKLPWRHRWPDPVRDEVLARLLALNAERYEEEVNLGMQGAGKKTPKPRTKPKSNGNAAQPSPFELTS
jgi:hypothetical protein